MKTPDPISPEKARVLVAEDHPLNQMFMRKSLERFGIGHFERVGGLQQSSAFGTAIQYASDGVTFAARRLKAD